MKSKTEVTTVFDFSKLTLHSNGKSALVLGYRVELTDKEYVIVKTLLEKEKAIHKGELAKAVDVAESALPVHIANINKKALPITERRLIEGNRRGEYRISEKI